MNEKPRVAVVGAGYWGKNLVRNFHEIGALAGICDAESEIVERFCRDYEGCLPFSTLDDVLRNDTIEAVALATPAETHGRLVRQVLEAGKDVFVEKPLCLSVGEGEELVALARQSERILMVGHLLWYHPAVLKLKELVDEGELGRIQYIYSNRLNIGKIRREENILWSFAPHDISVILGLIGEEPDTVSAQGGNYLHSDIADVTVSLLTFRSGIKAHVFVSWLHPFKEQKLVVVGDRKMAVFDDIEPDDKLMVYPHTIEWRNRVPVATKAQAERIDYEITEPLRAECLHFIECVATRRQPRTDGREGLRVLATLQRCEDALKHTAPGPEKPVAEKRVETNYFAHPSAFIDEDVEIGDGTKIWHVSHVMSGSKIGVGCNIGQNVVIGPDAIVGNNVKIQNNVSVYRGVTLEDDVFCGPSMVFTNVTNPRSAVPRKDEFAATLIKKGASLGANSTIVCGTTVGSHALVGAGSVVSRDVPDHALVYGVPASIKGWVCRCGLKLKWEDDRAECECGLAYVQDDAEHVSPTDRIKA